MKAGILKEKIGIYKSVEKTTEFGNKQHEWVFYKFTRAAVTNRVGTRSVENNEIIFPVVKEFIVRYYVDIDENMRIKLDDKFYRILSIDKNKYYNDKLITAELINE